MAESVPLFRMEGISKRYGGVRALEKAELTVEPGRIHAILGENGAGKSTLIKVMAGVVAPDEGRMTMEGSPLAFASPAAANQAGIACIRLVLAIANHQERRLGDVHVAQEALEALRPVAEAEHAARIAPDVVAAPAEVAEREVFLGQAGGDRRFEVTVSLETLDESSAKEDHAVVFFEFERGVGGQGGQRRGELKDHKLQNVTSVHFGDRGWRPSECGICIIL